MNLPQVFVNNIKQAFGKAGERFLEDLPDLLAQATRRWELTIVDPYLLSYNYVCPATCPDGTPAVLKIGVPNRELTSEINTLRLYGGQGACQLYRSDPEAGMLLLERLTPGSMLTTLKDDDEATGVAADLLCAIHQPAPDQSGFLCLRGWFDELKGLRSAFGGTSGPFPGKTVNIVEGLLRELFSENNPQVLLHGDFHQFNILLSDRGWLVIDPKGVVGPAGYEVTPFLMNPWNKMPTQQAAIQRTERRIAIFAERMELDPKQLKAWAICHSLLSAWWDTNADGTGGEYSLAWTEIFLQTRV